MALSLRWDDLRVIDLAKLKLCSLSVPTPDGQGFTSVLGPAQARGRPGSSTHSGLHGRRGMRERGT
jgi:hypothetical protein